ATSTTCGTTASSAAYRRSTPRAPKRSPRSTGSRGSSRTGRHGSSCSMTRTISPPFPNFRPISNKPGVALENKARRLGERERFMPRLMAPAVVDAGLQRLKHREMVDISNLEVDGSILAVDDRRRMFNLGNQLWHTDSSFKATPAKHSMLHARAIPPQGGETEFADMRAAWDALPEATRTLIEPLVCDHSLLYSRALLGFDAFTEAERHLFAPVPQRLVRRHMGSGRRSLFLASHIGSIHGWPRPEAMALIRELTEHATQREFVYRHP